MSLFKRKSAIVTVKKGSYEDGGGYKLLQQWANSDSVFGNNPHSLIRAYKNIVYTCANKNATVMSRQKLHLYMVSPKGFNSKSYKTANLNNTKNKADVLMRSPGNTKSLVLYSDDYDISEIVEHPFLDLMETPNSTFSKTEFLQLSQLYMELTGNCYWNINKNAFGIPDSLYILPSQYVEPVLGNDRYIDYYKYISKNSTVRFGVDQILHNRFPNPANISVGVSPLEAVTDSVNLDTASLAYANAIMKNMGVLAGYFRAKENLSKDVFEKLKGELLRFMGYKNAGQTPLLDNNLEYVPTSIDPSVLFDAMITKKTDKDICRAYGVPISLVDTDNVNKANAQTGSSMYEEHTIDPRLRLLADKINQVIIPLYPQKSGVKIFCAFDNPAKEDNAFVLKKQESFTKLGIMSPNEVRKEEGLPPRDGGDDFYVPINSAIMRDGELIMPANEEGDDNARNSSSESE